ncbi:MAG TPA: DUF1302 family protein [Candidatus Kryptonia bacterium]|nr:DUF1302 family protein [Candidatus Kryptonia bacterium]
MRRITTWGGRWWLMGGLLVAVLARPATALYLDDDQNISLRSRIYSQAAIRINDSQGDTVPKTFSGQLVQHRNYFNPELDAKLTSYTTWMKNPGLSWLAPDDFSVRVAAWGFYDGVYDYGSGQFNDARKVINSTFNQFNGKPTHAWFLEGPTFNPNGTTLSTILPGYEVQNPHDIYATQRRINELYFNYSKGPFFLRLGRQAISWGESDTVALLDANNPFDLTLAAPGVFEDLDEARIPLWTVRTSLNLFETLGPLSSAFVEAYWVPGDIDNNTGTLPLLGASPYSPPGQDPQTNPTIAAFNKLPGVAPFQFILLDQVPKRNFENSRYGFRVQTVVNRTFTLSAWYYTNFQGTPAPIKTVPVALPADKRNLFIVATEHKLTATTGVANTFFFEPLDGIVRMEAEYFDNEPGFVPAKNLSLSNPLNSGGVLQFADHLRWELGFDRFFFLRALNPTNSFTLVSAIVGDYNMSETSKKDFRSAQQKPGAAGQVPNDFVQEEKVEAFGQVHLQTDYMHGRLSPGVTYIQNVRGTYTVTGDLLYRWTDWLLFDLSAVTIGGAFEQLGYFRDRDQLAFRITYQLN